MGFVFVFGPKWITKQLRTAVLLINAFHEFNPIIESKEPKAEAGGDYEFLMLIQEV